MSLIIKEKSSGIYSVILPPNYTYSYNKYASQCFNRDHCEMFVHYLKMEAKRNKIPIIDANTEVNEEIDQVNCLL